MRRLLVRGTLAGWLFVLACAGLIFGMVNDDELRSWLLRQFPLDVREPKPWFLDLRLAALREDRNLCRSVLASPLVRVEQIPDTTTENGCGWRNSVRIGEVGGARLAVPAMTCEQTAALTLWIAHHLQPLAARHLGSGVAAIEHRGGYACRKIRGAAALADFMSEHAFANALDISALVLADGRRIVIAVHWKGSGPEARVLREAHAKACRYFRVVLGPDYNAAHRDHFHLDRGRVRACR